MPSFYVRHVGCVNEKLMLLAGALTHTNLTYNTSIAMLSRLGEFHFARLYTHSSHIMCIWGDENSRTCVIITLEQSLNGLRKVKVIIYQLYIYMNRGGEKKIKQMPEIYSISR